MRTFIIGLFGGALVFAFFFLTGAVGDINVGPVSVSKPEAAEDIRRRLAEFQGSVGVEAWEVEADETARYYAGQLIAKPRAQADQNLNALAQAFSVSGSVAGGGYAVAESVARQVGSVESATGDTMLISVDFDVPGAPPRPPIVSPQSTDAIVQPMSFGFAARARAQAERARAAAERARDVAFTGASCDPDDTDLNARITCTIDELQASGEFEYVEKNFIASHEMEPGGQALFAPPTDPLYALQWHYLNQGSGDGQSPGGAGFEAFWERSGRGSREIVVAVVDTGLDLAHPDIASSDNVAPGVDMVSVPFYGNDGDGRDLDPTDPGDICDPGDPNAENSYHGTHVAGTIGAVATNNGDGVAGGAWEVKIVPVRALGRCGGLQSDINDAIRWAAGVEPTIVETPDGGTILYSNPNPADVINLSLGFHAPNGCPRSTQSAIDDARAAGAIIVAAAGNASVNVANYGPSGCDGVIAVAAGDAAGQLTGYSNYGDGVDLMAPGGDMTADLNGDRLPDGVLSTKRKSECRDPNTLERTTDCRYSFENGTSMAAPHVSAAFALLKSSDPGLSRDALERLVTQTALSPRAADQCVGSCNQMDPADRTPADGQPGMCYRPCGAGLLDLSRIAGTGGPEIPASTD